MNKLIVAVPLASLFSVLLSGCPIYPGCKSDSFLSPSEHELTPAEYAMWQMGAEPGTTTDPTTSDGSTGATSTGTTDASTTGTTDASTTGTTGTTGGGMLTEEETCMKVCEHHHELDEVDSCSVKDEGDKVVVTCQVVTQCVGGRHHACVVAREEGQASAAGAWLARAAHDEAASVAAFRALGRELAAHGAPPELLARIDAAGQEEVRHAEMVSLLARRHGAEVHAPEVVELPARELLAIAVENAVEGCVHETWAALTAAHQARSAAEPAVREIYAAIAVDEASHAELAWAIDAWLSGQLDAAGRYQVAQARSAAVRALADRLAASTDAPELMVLGLPPAGVASRLCANLDRALWSRMT